MAGQVHLSVSNRSLYNTHILTVKSIRICSETLLLVFHCDVLNAQDVSNNHVFKWIGNVISVTVLLSRKSTYIIRI
jgi:hypothetical protein